MGLVTKCKEIVARGGDNKSKLIFPNVWLYVFFPYYDGRKSTVNKVSAVNNLVQQYLFLEVQYL